LHPEKTRLLEFGRRASDRRDREGREPCETFEFLGFTHSCGKTRKNQRFVLLRRTSRKRISRTLAAIKVGLCRRRHERVGVTGRWLASVIRGWLGYHAIPDNYTRLDQFVTEVTKLWLHQLRRRSQKGRAAWPWSRMQHLVNRCLPQPKILHPYPKDRFRARLAAGAVWGSTSRTDLCGGRPVTVVPTAIPSPAPQSEKPSTLDTWPRRTPSNYLTSR